MQDLNLTLIQADLVWEDSRKNLDRFQKTIASIHHPTHLIVLPEMFSTGFTMDVAKCAEPESGPAMEWLREAARSKNCVVAGSVLTRIGEAYFNRFIWMRPDGHYDHYDKKHRFSMAGEHRVISAGMTQTIVELHGWKISLQVCYDLRFPVWSRNRYGRDGYAYDVLVYVANWPEVRKEAYSRLLPARAIENQSYVVWVNRVGVDGKANAHSGDSAVYGPDGNTLSLAGPGNEEVLNVALSADTLMHKRKNFLIGPDWDPFSLDQS